MHDWGPSLAIAAFCDENWSAKVHRPICGSPGKNYHQVVDLPMAR